MKNRKKIKYIFLLIFIIPLLSYAQPQSKIQGKVYDEGTGEALIGANVIILNTNIGAATNIDGEYFILNVPVGTYEVQASMIGYNKQTQVEVMVSVDRVTNLDFRLSSSVYQEQEVIIVAERNKIHKDVSNTQLVVTNDQITYSAGVRDINAFLEKQPGVSSSNGFLEIRGGSADQTGTFINGMSYNNAAVGNAETTIPLSAIEQVSLMSGGFNAEYGNFRSGLINVTTKSGTRDRYHGTFTVSRNIEHMKRFGPKLSDPRGPELAPYLNPATAFTGNDNFDGWIYHTNVFNQTREPGGHATPMDYYLLSAWMHMALPDYEGLEKLPDEIKEQIGYQPISDEQKRLFSEHARNEEGMDYNVDFGFGGPFPFFSDELWDATFYLSHTTKDQHYIVPAARESQMSHVTMGTIKTRPSKSLTLSINSLWKRQLGVSPLKPAFGDVPNSDREGGFMQLDNLRHFYRLSNLDGGVNYWFSPSIFPLLDQTTFMSGFTLNHVVSNSTFWEFSASYLTMKDHSPTGDNRNNSILTNFGPFPVSEMPYGKLQFAPNNRLTMINGEDTLTYLYPNYDALPGITARFRGKDGDLYTNVHTQQIKLKFDITSQLSNNHYLKSGIEHNRIDIDHKMWLKWNRTGPYNSYEYNYHRIPSQTGFYLQDQMSYEGIVANLGFRFDYLYSGGGKWPSGDPFPEAFTSSFGGAPRNAGEAADSFYAALASGRSLIWEKWEEYDRENPGFLQPIKNHLIFSPRLGISFPVTINSKFYFNYGHFRSNPPYYSMYLYRYRYDKNGLYGMSNPNLEPPKTISYELGVAYDFLGDFIINLSGYYKDVTGEHGEINYIDGDGTVDYDRWENNRYNDIQGIEINITKNDYSWITGWVNFNYMLKKSGWTGDRQIGEFQILEQFDGTEQKFLPAPMLNTNITFRTPRDWFTGNWINYLTSDWRFTVFAEWKAGGYFTYDPLRELGVITNLNNNMQWPDYYMVDLRVSKTFDLFGFNTSFFLDISNVLNLKVNLLSRGYAFRKTNSDDSFTNPDNYPADFTNYLASLRLPLYNSSEYDQLREQNPGYYIAGDDKVGDLKSDSKPYIDDPFYSYFIYGQPRDIWFGFRVDF
jgi:hypothetical protein